MSQKGTTQGDPLAMPMYAIGIIPVIQQLIGIARQVWYADNAAGDSLLHLKYWWCGMLLFDCHFGYHVNAAKTWLVVKQEYLVPAQHIFDGTGCTSWLSRLHHSLYTGLHISVGLGSITFVIDCCYTTLCCICSSCAWLFQIKADYSKHQ